MRQQIVITDTEIPVPVQDIVLLWAPDARLREALKHTGDIFAESDALLMQGYSGYRDKMGEHLAAVNAENFDAKLVAKELVKANRCKQKMAKLYELIVKQEPIAENYQQSLDSYKDAIETYNKRVAEGGKKNPAGNVGLKTEDQTEIQAIISAHDIICRERCLEYRNEMITHYDNEDMVKACQAAEKYQLMFRLKLQNKIPDSAIIEKAVCSKLIAIFQTMGDIIDSDRNRVFIGRDNKEIIEHYKLRYTYDHAVLNMYDNYGVPLEIRNKVPVLSRVYAYHATLKSWGRENQSDLYLKRLMDLENEVHDAGDPQLKAYYYCEQAQLYSAKEQYGQERNYITKAKKTLCREGSASDNPEIVKFDAMIIQSYFVEAKVKMDRKIPSDLQESDEASQQAASHMEKLVLSGNATGDEVREALYIAINQFNEHRETRDLRADKTHPSHRAYLEQLIDMKLVFAGFYKAVKDAGYKTLGNKNIDDIISKNQKKIGRLERQFGIVISKISQAKVEEEEKLKEAAIAVAEQAYRELVEKETAAKLAIEKVAAVKAAAVLAERKTKQVRRHSIEEEKEDDIDPDTVVILRRQTAQVARAVVDPEKLYEEGKAKGDYKKQIIGRSLMADRIIMANWKMEGPQWVAYRQGLFYHKEATSLCKHWQNDVLNNTYDPVKRTQLLKDIEETSYIAIMGAETATERFSEIAADDERKCSEHEFIRSELIKKGLWYTGKNTRSEKSEEYALINQRRYDMQRVVEKLVKPIVDNLQEIKNNQTMGASAPQPALMPYNEINNTLLKAAARDIKASKALNTTAMAGTFSDAVAKCSSVIIAYEQFGHLLQAYPAAQHQAFLTEAMSVLKSADQIRIDAYAIVTSYLKKAKTDVPVTEGPHYVVKLLSGNLIGLAESYGKIIGQVENPTLASSQAMRGRG